MKEAGLTKQEIRILSREAGLSTWDKPSCACLASRLEYGQTITKEKLQMVEQAEQMLMDIGFLQVRVRVHDRMARIELEPESIGRFMEEKIRTNVIVIYMLRS